jgi:hypothetical protein
MTQLVLWFSLLTSAAASAGGTPSPGAVDSIRVAMLDCYAVVAKVREPLRMAAVTTTCQSLRLLAEQLEKEPLRCAERADVLIDIAGVVVTTDVTIVSANGQRFNIYLRVGPTTNIAEAERHLRAILDDVRARECAFPYPQGRQEVRFEDGGDHVSPPLFFGRFSVTLQTFAKQSPAKGSAALSFPAPFTLMLELRGTSNGHRYQACPAKLQRSVGAK